MGYHHLALAAKDMKAVHDFYEGVMGFELVKVEIAPVMGGGWGKHFFYRMDGDDSKWNAAGLDVLEIDHNWCHSVYTRDPNGNMVEFCLTTGSFDDADRARAIAALDETEMHASPAPAMMKHWLAKDAV
ncbi:VOC family protein [Sphingorhabdus arenilitoris]|uniref:VOC family protein n=1 Tax=Sphingorhabdus arenilitoris TaxID=1490041 RepID=A0ABV8RLK0_9SPHN